MPRSTEIDYGTPRRSAENRPSRWRSTASRSRVPAGTSVMRAAVDAGVKVPKLCATDSLEPFGSCRLCLVEIEGRARHAGLLHHAGRARHEGAHADRRSSPELRRGVMELYISDHPLDCLTCAGQRQLRAAGHGRRRRPARGALRLRGRQPPAQPRRTSRIPTSPSTRRSASSARAACAPARKCRAPSR